MKYPGEVCTPSTRIYEALQYPDYPFYDKIIPSHDAAEFVSIVEKLIISVAFAGQTIEIAEVSGKTWLVSFMHYNLGFFDEDENKVQPTDNPFMPNVLPISSV